MYRPTSRSQRSLRASAKSRAKAWSTDALIISSISASRSPASAVRACCCSANFWRKWACATECLSSETAMKVLEAKVKNQALLELDRKALAAGRVYIDHTVAIGAVTQADGFAQ